MEPIKHAEYYGALERLKKDKPTILPKGTKINNDNVALEAGRKKGAIKSGRKGFSELIEDIDDARKKQVRQKNKSQADVNKYKRLYSDYRKKYADALSRELGLVERLSQLEKALVEIESKEL